MNLNEIKRELLNFREERDWSKFHDPKNLAEAISIEASELLELFLWKNKQEIEKDINSDLEYKTNIEDELADIFTYCIQMANTLDLDIEKIIFKKLEKVKIKYPIDKATGNHIKYSKL
ncbi:MAG TPA: nucleotide pyrophosphohydrolase [Candidatus Cloacimonas acidaminovorans]|nr:nucleotide pyrophosphohydrolase [Candidatus Cloacimonas acidaminovorans]